MRISDWSSDVCSSDLSKNSTRSRNSNQPTDRDIRRLYSAIALPLGKSTRLNVCQPRCCGKTCRPSPSQRSGRTGPPSPHDGGSPAWVLPSRSGRQQRPSPSRSDAHTSELQSLMRISYAVFCLKNKKKTTKQHHHT